MPLSLHDDIYDIEIIGALNVIEKTSKIDTGNIFIGDMKRVSKVYGLRCFRQSAGIQTE